MVQATVASGASAGQATVRFVPRMIRKTANQTAGSGATLENVDDMSFTVVSGRAYYWWLFILHNVDGTPDMDVAWTVPAGTGRHGLTSAANTTSAVAAEVRIAGDGAVSTTVMHGHFVPTADGTVQLQFAEGTADAADTIILADTAMIVWEMS